MLCYRYVNPGLDPTNRLAHSFFPPATTKLKHQLNFKQDAQVKEQWFSRLPATSHQSERPTVLLLSVLHSHVDMHATQRSERSPSPGLFQGVP